MNSFIDLEQDRDRDPGCQNIIIISKLIPTSLKKNIFNII